MNADTDQENAGIEFDRVVQRQQAGAQHGAVARVSPKPMPHRDDADAERGDGSAGCIHHPHAKVSRLARHDENTGRS
ncbi:MULTISPECIES: hypothetical protein [unclassified Bradyrhizobium]|uniref:hypothetical protein n=1 Tax=unclassified Bradyrhizobium TaxID=2631580 RepID=UPI001BA49AA1|nr:MULTISPECIES: hypothetical protein [unclassified Bradyrhizobium]MBR1205986.1 hypothetical protein [Bradyrhizobium sp. AUGA SZCCT0124]MBR1314887.1 hypothetical protein [Bradyrhizobium sp. AUGA SZCCT0051]MBR1341858.1 hypothetical protein [Bradyrhizobium sp. AUGA SZCCT0105]MBR1358740.1 hypothetical protein [Bradyrhizobium sp. AUGA SZCCT0045]